MKRIISAVLTVILVLSVFSSCGRYIGKSERDDDEDVESGATQENPDESDYEDNEEDAQSGATEAGQESEPADMEDVDALYEFVGQDYPGMSKSSFEL